MSSATASDPRYLKQDENGKWIVAVGTTIAPAKRGRRPGTPNPNGGRHPSTEPKTRVSLTAEAAGLLAEFAAMVNAERGEATRQDEIASAIIVAYLNSNPYGMLYNAGAIAERIDAAQEAGKP